MKTKTPIVLTIILLTLAFVARFTLADETPAKPPAAVLAEQTEPPKVAISPPATLDAKPAEPNKEAVRPAPPIAEMIKRRPERERHQAKADKPIELQSVKAAQASNAPPATVTQPAPTFQDGVMYGSVLRLRNQDVDGPTLLRMAAQAWYRDHQAQGAVQP